MIDANGGYDHCLKRIRRLAAGEGFSLLTFKGDRGLHVERRTDGRLALMVFGFAPEECVLEDGEFRKKLKGIMKREFPRSNRLRVRRFAAGERSPFEAP